MKNETKIWLDYAEENLKSAEILMDNSLYNSCLQNIQQGIEKLLKSIIVERSGTLIKTHSISKLKQTLEDIAVGIDISDDECDLIDTIYLPSKYPIGSVIPDYDPNMDICRQCMEIARRVEKYVKRSLTAVK
jgi:HEPN domain-containing protein